MFSLSILTHPMAFCSRQNREFFDTAEAFRAHVQRCNHLGIFDLAEILRLPQEDAAQALACAA